MKKKPRIKKQKIGYVNDGGFWPRVETARILKLKTKELMFSELNKLRPNWKDWVKTYLNARVREAGGIDNYILKRDVKADE